jgi:hypothetical protein
VINYDDVVELTPHCVTCPAKKNPSLPCTKNCIETNINSFEVFKKYSSGPGWYLPSYLLWNNGDLPPFFYSSDGKRWSVPKQVVDLDCSHPYLKGQFYQDIISGKFIKKTTHNMCSLEINYDDVVELTPHCVTCPAKKNPSLPCTNNCIKNNIHSFEVFKNYSGGPDGYLPSYLFWNNGDLPPFFYSSDGKRWSTPKQVVNLDVLHPYFKGQFYEDIMSGKFIKK